MGKGILFFLAREMAALVEANGQKQIMAAGDVQMFISCKEKYQKIDDLMLAYIAQNKPASGGGWVRKRGRGSGPFAPLSVLVPAPRAPPRPRFRYIGCR